MKNVKVCPFCGEEPEVSNCGTWVYIECCASMGRQKSDYLTMEERHSIGSPPEYPYAKEVEEKVLNLVLKEWNTRV